MLNRNDYIYFLEKNAEEEKNDSHKTALEEVSTNKKSTKETLKSLFKETGESSLAKDFPGESKKESGHVFTKVAKAVFIERAMNLPFFKKASQAYLNTAFLSFQRELGNIPSSY